MASKACTRRRARRYRRAPFDQLESFQKAFWHFPAIRNFQDALQLLRILTPDLDDVKSYRLLLPTGQLKCAHVLATRNVHTPWPMVITEAACARPMSRKTEINRQAWARSFSKSMPYLYEGISLASAPLLPVEAYKLGPVGPEKSCFEACLASSLQASRTHQRHLETSASASLLSAH
jgi:hypothetical protein